MLLIISQSSLADVIIMCKCAKTTDLFHIMFVFTLKVIIKCRLFVSKLFLRVKEKEKSDKISVLGTWKSL